MKTVAARGLGNFGGLSGRLTNLLILLHFGVLSRAEPLLARIKADRTVVVSPVFDKVHFDDLHVERYIPFAHGFDWALWCLYEAFSPAWLKMADESQPGKYVEKVLLRDWLVGLTSMLKCYF